MSLAEAGVFLRRPADDRERPDRVRPVIDVLHVQHRKVVGEAVVAEVIAERAFGQLPRRIDGAGDAEIGLGRHRQERVRFVGRRPHQPHAPAAQRAGEGQFRHSLGQRHHGGEGHGRRPADEDVDAERHAAAQRLGMMDADAAMDLVVQADLAIRLVLVAGQLHAIHAEVGVPPAGPVGVLGVDLRQRDEGAAVARPALQLRQLAHRRLVIEDRPASDELRPRVPQGAAAHRGSATAASRRRRDRP